MIKLERTSVMNLENAIRGARNPMNSWNRMDSVYKTWEEGAKDVYDESFKSADESYKYYVLGENDLGLAVRLRKAGSDHRKYIRQIFVSVDITAPLYWWKEYDTYKVSTTANSTSTMHKLSSKPITMSDISCDKMSPDMFKATQIYLGVIECKRQDYLAESDPVLKKQYWYDMIQSLPSSWNQTRTCTMSYENLVNMYHARKNHKLDEWHVFCDWIATLPYAKELIICED
jgi:hypothetical protein